MFIVGLIMGFLLVISLSNLWLEEEKQKTYEAEKRAIKHFERVNTLESVNKQYQEEHEILLNNSAELRARIVDLENNVEFLYNNLTPTKKKLARPDNQN